MVHEQTCFPEDSELYFTNYGAIQFLTADMEPDFILDFAEIDRIGSSSG